MILHREYIFSFDLPKVIEIYQARFKISLGKAINELQVDETVLEYDTLTQENIVFCAIMARAISINADIRQSKSSNGDTTLTRSTRDTEQCVHK